MPAVAAPAAAATGATEFPPSSHPVPVSSHPVPTPFPPVPAIPHPTPASSHPVPASLHYRNSFYKFLCLKRHVAQGGSGKVSHMAQNALVSLQSFCCPSFFLFYPIDFFLSNSPSAPPFFKVRALVPDKCCGPPHEPKQRCGGIKCSNPDLGVERLLLPRSEKSEKYIANTTTQMKNAQMSVCWRRELSPVRGPTTARECCVVCRRCVVNVLFAVVLVQSMCLPSCDCLSVVVCFANSNVRKRRESTSNSGERSYRSTRTRTRGTSCNTAPDRSEL